MKIERAAIECATAGVSDRHYFSTDALEHTKLEQTKTVELGPLAPGLSVAVADASEDASRLSDLLAETLYGIRTTESLDRPTYLQHLAGNVDVGSDFGRFRLRRRSEAGASGRFTIAGLDGQAAGGDTISALLQTKATDAVARVFYASPATHGDLASLLSETVARELQQDPAATVHRQTSPTNTEELLARRDAVAHEIERRLADRRVASEELEGVLSRLDAEAAELRTRRGTLDNALQGVLRELAQVESNLRYQAIAEETERAAASREASDWRPRIDELESQIEQWRATLAELEAREAEVRSELSAIHPDDAEPSLPLADQRAGLAVARRLTEDLESEVARLARSTASDICVCRDAHPRMNPLVDTLGKQLTRLADLAEQQERALHVQSLRSEAAHLSRSQDDLRKQLDHLLERRQTLWRTTRARPEDDVREDISELNARTRADLDARRAELEGELATLDKRLAEIAAERDALVHRRSALLSDASLESPQAELHDLQARLRAPSLQASSVTTTANAPWRASEWFTKLTDGRYAGLRLTNGGRRLAVIDAAGAERTTDSLSASEHQLAAMSLRLALVAGFAQRGVHLPLVLEEPFAGLDSRQTAILANVLDDFSRLGFQVLVFTGNGVALDRFKALGAPLLRIARGVPSAKTEAVTARRFEVETAPASSAVTSRVVQHTVKSEYLLDPEDPISRFPVPIADRETVFARSRVRTISDLMSADPSALAEELDRDDVTAELAALWQTHTALVCFVPGMTFDEASILTSIDVLSADDLAESDADELYARLRDFLASDRGQRFSSRGYSRNHVADWIANAGRGQRKWRGSSHWDGWRRHRGERRERVSRNATRRRSERSEWDERGERSRRSTRSQSERRLRVRSAESDSRSAKSKRSGRASSKQTKKREWRFYLETTSPVVDAPSIGPKTAAKLEAAGVRTVADLLAADPESLAASLDNHRITDETIVAWQHQAQLVCRIPQIRGHDAQILVECGFTQPEEIASMKPAELLEFVEPFCATSEGQKILRNGKAPDLAEVTDWINWSQHCRMLGAA